MGHDYVVGIGELLWDMFPEGRKLGGAPSNFAYHASQMGMNGLSVSAVGDDEPGRSAMGELAEKKLSRHVDVVDFPTGTVRVTVDAAGKPEYGITENVAWDNMPYTGELELVAMQTRAVCFGSLAQRSPVTAATILRFLDAIPDRKGVYRIFDVNLRQHYYTPEVLDRSMRRCNVLKLNDEEIVLLAEVLSYGDIHIHDVCWKIMDAYGLDVLILTCGARGSYVFSPGGVTFRESPAVDVVDTVGAGDSFTAAFTAALIRGRSLAHAHDLAVEVSAYVCTQPGAMAPLPEWLKAML